MSEQISKKISFFPFQWCYDQGKNDDNFTIRVYGWNRKNENVCCIIDDFSIPIWIELDDTIEWTEGKISLMKNKLRSLVYGKNSPVSIDFKKQQKLYFADVVKSGTNSYKPMLFPFLQLNFKGLYAVSTFMKAFSKEKLNYYDKVDINQFREVKIMVSSIGEVKLRFHCYESSISPIIKLFAVQNLPSSSWIHVTASPVLEEDKQTTKQHEYRVSYKKMIAFTQEECLKMPIVYPKILSYDIEVYSSKAPAFPKASISGDKVFQIGASICEQKGKEKKYKKILLTLGKCGTINHGCDPIEDVEVRVFSNEKDIYQGFKNLMIEEDPDVIIGYNIFKFDILYMHERNINFFDASCEYTAMGCIPGKKASLIPIKWESSAYGKQEMKYLDIEGRLMIDLFPYVVRSYKLTNYKLDTVANEFLKTGKDPLSANDIFRLYDDKSSKSTAIIGKYCIQDTWVTLLLFEKLLVWFDLVETATTNGVPIFYLYTKGQQIKMYSQLLKYCYHNNIVIQSKVYEVKEDEEYSGAYVSDPIPGLYKSILPFDFASLYPSIIIAYNIDYTKLVLDSSIPDEHCHIIKWSDHLSCKHDPKIIQKTTKKKEQQDKSIQKIMKGGKSFEDAETEVIDKIKPTKKCKVICGDFRFRFLKQEVSGKGTIPTLIEMLLKARKDTRKIIQQNETKIKDGGLSETEISRLKEINSVLDKRQLAYKVSANSMYGAMGVKVGYLPFPPGAMCVTATGRQSILKASAFLESDCGGKVIYNDTDSAYTYFECLKGKSMEEIWKYAEDVVEKVKKLFPAPIKLEFEEKVYTKFLILTKKRYAALACELGKPEKLIKRGIVLQRRDNCMFLRTVYEKILYNLLENIDEYTDIKEGASLKELFSNKAVNDLVSMLLTDIDKLFQSGYNYNDFVITKGMKQLVHKGKSDPSHIAVAKKMIARGQPVEDGARIEYVLLDKGDVKYKLTDKVSEKCDDANYYMEHRDILKIDFLSYLQRYCMKPIDELLRVGTRIPKLIEEQFILRLQKKKYLSGLNKLFEPVITLED